MPLFFRTSLAQLNLPIPEADYKFIKDRDLMFLLDLHYSDTWLATKNVLFLTEEQEQLKVAADLVVDYQESWTNGCFYLNGKVQYYGDVISGKYLIGVFSYERNTHGWLWAGDFRAKLKR